MNKYTEKMYKYTVFSECLIFCIITLFCKDISQISYYIITVKKYYKIHKALCLLSIM